MKSRASAASCAADGRVLLSGASWIMIGMSIATATVRKQPSAAPGVGAHRGDDERRHEHDHAGAELLRPAAALATVNAATRTTTDSHVPRWLVRFAMLVREPVTSATLQAKLGGQIEDYVILGACNPTFASRALGIDRSIGLLLP